MDKKNRILCAAVDVGTTTVSAVVLDITNARQLEAFTLPNDSTLVSQESFEHAQNAVRILEIAVEIVDSVFDKYPDISGLGFTGQMHGMLYVDADGNALSPLYTWQDGRANFVCADGKTYCEEITDLCGMAVSAGFGLATHYYNIKNGLVPAEAKSICTVMDYLVMHFAGLKTPVMHPSNAASFGLFDIIKGDFDLKTIKKLGINESILPAVTHDNKPVGKYRGAAVIAAIGDNQASVFGSVADEENALLVNYGTGSQVSVISDVTSVKDPLEVRPYLFGKNLVCGCALCGGSAYAILEKFFRTYSEACGGDKGNQYKVMDRLAEGAYGDGNPPLEVSTLFKGTRADPQKRASICGIGEDNFTPEQLILGTIHGMVNELYEMYVSCGEKRSALVASGNAVQKGRVLQSVLCDRFGMPLVLPSNKEEAATGAAMYAAMCADSSLSVSTVKNCIKYMKSEQNQNSCVL